MYLDMYLIKTSIQLTVREYSKTERKVKVKKINNPLIVKRAAVGPLSFEQIFYAYTCPLNLNEFYIAVHLF